MKHETDELQKLLEQASANQARNKMGAFSWLYEWVETAKAQDFALKSNVQIAQEPKRCMGCNVRLNEECVAVLTDAGYLADDENECAYCKAESVIRLAAKMSEVTAEEIQRALDVNRHYEN